MIAVAAAAFAAPAHADGNLSAYVRARAAAEAGAVEVAAAGYATALAADPANPLIAIRAFREGIAAGDLALARRALSVLEKSDVAPPDSALLRFADALVARDTAAAIAATDRLGEGPLDFIGPVLRAWLALGMRGGDPFAVLDAAEPNALTRRYAAENRALLLIATGNTQQGVEALQALLGSDEASFDLRVNAAQLLAGRREKRLAQALLGGSDPAIAAQRKALGRGVRPSPAFGAARLFMRLGADLNREETAQLSILLARAALLLEPGSDRAKLLLADALSRDGADTRALATLDAIAPDSPFASQVRALRVTVLTRGGDAAQALAAATRVADSPTATAADAQNLGDLLVGEGRYDAAADAYRLAAARGGEDDWIVQIQLGGALEQAGRWDEALPHLRRAVELAPEQPVALNYLGYAQAERGEQLSQAVAMLEKASALVPGDPSIADSLGWAYYRSGDAARAVPLIERAARDDPGSTTINEHLGDVYWRIGRRYEARYAWRAAAVYAEGEAADRIADKIAGGLVAASAQR
ncbi:tetratricopeptide repeat protein [Sphingomonas japonica]|uniref:Flp pilus assembly protein TadD n=1 Tax=Sphingomonas japonica TaxID=511662 RepID=A0ABX0U8H2_9SPHN|nr:tetratricopeptide repeat protein [Sphingomonas japonica]NIJ25068.1 Flp pilus assembly protein TadD [Sphingomonas japonica]